MRNLLIVLFIACASMSLAQVSDDFSDGDFTNSPTWSGDNGDFDASGFDLHLDAAAAGESYLSTTQTELGETTWEILVHFDFNPSSTSLSKIYLVSDQSDLTGSLNGYFVMVGDTEDEISLYKQEGTTETYVIDGTDDTIDAGTVNVRVRVTRDASGNWSLYHDVTGGTTYTQEGTATSETSFTTTTHFGVFCQYTLSRINAIYFDDVSVSTAAAGFAVSSLAKEGDNAIRITFNQDVDETTAETLSNYTLDYGFGNPSSAERDVTNLDEVLITFTDDFVNNDYTLNVDQVQNVTLDESIDDVDQGFVVELQTPFRYIVVNEIMADPSPVVGLPDAEYLELYNAGDQAINIGDFMIDARTISDFVLEANAYVTLTTIANVGSFSGDVVGLSGLSLSNGGEALELTDNLGNLVDSVSYTSDWYNDVDKDDGGYSLEQINPNLLCSYENNWTASSHADGGTPGVQNNVFDNSPDISGPNLIDFIATDANTFLLTFDEPMDESSLNSATYSFDNGISENGISPTSPGFFNTFVDVTPDMSSGVEYTVTVTGATDCTGNAIQTNSLSYTFDTNPPALDKIVVKTSNQIELIFDENLNETVAETESNYSSDHSGANPSTAILDDTDASIVTLTFDDDFELEVENTLTISNIEDIQGNALASPLTPTFILTQQIDSVWVLGINLLDIYFNVALDQITAETEANYSVNDGVGNPATAFLDEDNDQLVHLVFANNFDDNDELILTVSSLQDEDLNDLTTPEITFIYDTSAPKLDTVMVTSSNTLEVVFTEKVEQQSAESLENYEYDDIYPIEASLQSDQVTVVLEFKEDFEKEVYFELSIDEVKDLYLNEIKTKLKQTFVYDVFEPKLDSIIVRSSNELILWFNENVDETTAENTANYAIGESIGEPDLATLNLELPHIVYLNLPSTLPESAGIDLEISDMKDQHNNAIESSITTTFDYDQFYISTITPISGSTLQIEFNKTPEESTATTISNYSINGINPTTIVFPSARIAELTIADTFTDNSNNQLVITNLEDLSSNEIYIDTYSYVFDSKVVAGSVVSNRSVLLDFELDLDQSQSLDLSNFDASPSLGNCVSANIDSDDPNLLRLTFEEAIEPDLIYTIQWSQLTNVYGNDLPGFSVGVIDDQTPPAITNYLVLDSKTIWLQYSEPLNENSAEFFNNYIISPDIGYPIDAQYAEADSSVILEFEFDFVEQTNYILSADNIEDLSDNALFDYTLEFTYSAPVLPGFGDLIITEIMADPTPEVGLPDTEYLEIFNTTDEAISLVGVELIDEGGRTMLVSGEIESGEYAILTSTSGTNDFTGINVIGVTSFPSLNNSGETISLYAGESQIFSTSYNSNWYKDGDKEDGGWSFEMIDVGNPCGEIKNWTASVDESGGTPGMVNSTSASNPDNFGPTLLTAIATEEGAILIEMNEKLHPEQFESASIEIDPTINIDDIQLVSPNNNQIELELSGDLEAGQWYEITVDDVADCSNNIIQTDANTARLRRPELADNLDIVINEVLFNPRTGGVDFVELYNKSDKTINLKGWFLTDEYDDLRIITDEHLILNPNEYLVLTPDPTILIDQYPNGDESRFYQMESFPGLSDDQDSVLLVSVSAHIIDEFEYQDDYHFQLLDDDEGVSLERISFDAESSNPDSWKSTASTAGFATPGKLNSQFKDLNQNLGKITIEPKVFVPDNTGTNDFTTINYQLDQAGNFANVHIYSVNGVLIKTLAEGELLSTNGFFTWDGLTNNGSRAAVGYYVVHFEFFDGQGNRSTQKETVVLGARF